MEVLQNGAAPMYRNAKRGLPPSQCTLSKNVCVYMYLLLETDIVVQWYNSSPDLNRIIDQ